MTLPLIPAPGRMTLLEGDPYVPDTSVGAPAVSGASGNTVGDGSYRLRVDAEGIDLSAEGPGGWSAGMATLQQLVDLAGGTIPSIEIEDAPLLRWRGLMVDIARHFFGVSTLRKVIDLCASYKLNVLHLHLTDDQGWRYEVWNRPELTETSKHTQVGGEDGGFLTTVDLENVVTYAAERGIAVVGEIDLPGHTHAAQHAIAKLNPDGVSPAAYTGTAVGHSTLHLDLPETPAFLEDVVAALAVQTPGEFLHVGGDEVQLLTPQQYGDFIRHVEALVLAHGKRPVFWQEAAQHLQDTRSVVQMWKSNDDPAEVIEAAQRGHDVILSTANRTYLDLKHDAKDRLGLVWAGMVDLDDAYDWDPATIYPGLPTERILGIEAALWTETLETEDDLFRMLLPRLAAFAEVAWSAPQVRDWDTFIGGLPAHVPLWSAAGLSHTPRPALGL